MITTSAVTSTATPGSASIAISAGSAASPSGSGSPADAPLRHADAAVARLREHLAAEGSDLVACCWWLGGPRWRVLAQSLVDAVQRARTLGRWQRSLLQAVHRLLTLELVDDLGSDEAARYAELNMNDPRVVRCCQHAQVLGDALRALRAADVAARRRGRRVHVPAA